LDGRGISATFAVCLFKFLKTHSKMFQRSYETVFILTPVLSDVQMKDTVDKFVNLLKEEGADVINVENWGLKKMAYTIEKKTTGFYVLVEFKGDPTIIKKFELEIRREEKVMRFLTTVLDKHAIVYADRRRKGEFNKKVEAKEEQGS
jgi:small subunit ribosomal protein S6